MGEGVEGVGGGCEPFGVVGWRCWGLGEVAGFGGGVAEGRAAFAGDGGPAVGGGAGFAAGHWGGVS